MRHNSKIVRIIIVLSLLLFLLYIFIFVSSLMAEAAGTSRMDSPYGVDFGVYYTAGRMVLSGESDRIFDIAAHHAALEEVLQRQLPFYLPWLYPPVFLLAIVPFCFVPFTTALVLWLVVTFLLALFALYKLLPKYKGLAF